MAVASVLGLLSTPPVGAAPIVVATVTPAGTLFHYDVEITFDPADDEIAVLTVNVLADDTTLINLVAPAGYLAFYDSVGGQGFLDFLPVIAFPLSGTLAGFSFDSAHAPGATTFDALTILGGTITGATTGPVGAVVPEPAAGMLLTIGLGVLTGRRTTRKPTRSLH